ncbi:hypothetical protein Tco_0924452 [Tanacetum coccineum]|uniref:Uncharacterized protein n=1 Tax=Tanacetum coccineum TaxID=301880 RepID=A0ABQ5D6X7_9ASTR
MALMQKFNLEANAVINLSFKLSSFDSVVDITDDAEVTLCSDVRILKGSIQGNKSRSCSMDGNNLIVQFIWYRQRGNRHAVAIALASRKEKEFPLAFHADYSMISSSHGQTHKIKPGRPLKYQNVYNPYGEVAQELYVVPDAQNGTQT